MTDAQSGRKAQAARNDRLIREAARAVFVDDPDAPIAAVAEHAGVGISALYRRYGSKEELLRSLADEGMDRYLALVRDALDDDGDVWAAFRAFLGRCLETGAGSLTGRLAGRFPVTDDMARKGREIHAATEELLARARAAGVLRGGVEVGDVAVLLEYLHSVRIGGAERRAEIQRRCLDVIVDGLRAGAPLEGAAPDWTELRNRHDR
ncbi:TetR/AcrR family transcriptional regulator [Actinomadura atramentaria]|uniref:TetR/AcrR family transcriptional regulator n=1 Tax=Actinomadura atramentaria TaxID=1990 RepID=UPI00196A0494|nr:TetR/AcrR family transcriptional regulator [Actinomadura atramentaria]